MEVYHRTRVHCPNRVTAYVGSAPRRASGHIQLGIVGRWVPGDIGRIVSGHPAEHLQLVVNVVIDPLGKVVIAVVLNVAFPEVIHPGDIVTRIVRRPELLDQRRGQRIESVRWNDVTGERGARDGAGSGIELCRERIPNRAQGTVDVERTREIAPRLGGGPHSPGVTSWI